MEPNIYRLLDSGGFQKLEQVGPYRLVRPAPGAVWRPRLDDREWTSVDAVFTRFTGGDGKWRVFNPNLPESWAIETPQGAMVIRLTDFGHLGIFPEQLDNWKKLAEVIAAAVQSQGEVSVLNLFAYTGGATLAAAAGGARVVHLDASKTSVSWARENAEASGLQERPVRWIVDDVQKFVDRERRRGSRYQGVILDPPSYGRGPRGQTWKIEDHLTGLLNGLKELLADDTVFVLLSAHSTGYTPLALRNLLEEMCGGRSGSFHQEEMIIRGAAGDRPLPSGASCFFLSGRD